VRRTQRVSAAFAGVLLNVAEVVIIIEALKDHVPKGDQRSESPRVEGVLGKGQPAGQQGGWQKFVKLAEQLLGGAAGAQQWEGKRIWFFGKVGRAWGWFKGVFLDGN
jgi:hypothetical protein